MPKQRARADASRAYKRFKEAAKKAGVTARNPSSRAMPWAAGSGVSQKSSLPQAAKSVSRVLMSDEEEWIRASSAIAHRFDGVGTNTLERVRSGSKARLSGTPAARQIYPREQTFVLHAG